MKDKQGGFTLIEILIAIGILAIIMAMNSTLLQELIRGTRQQGAVVASQFETALGLETFRNDLGNAGYGLPDGFSGTIDYDEPTADGDSAASFNDGNAGVPRSIALSNGVTVSGFVANSDYLVIKSPAVGMNNAANKWTYVTSGAAPVHVWGDGALDMENGNYMIVIRPRVSIDENAQLIVVGGDYSLTYSGSALSDANFLPSTGERYIAYGIDTNSEPVMPFNRADYYVRRTSATSAGCAPGTGTLYKSVADHSTTSPGFTQYAMMDCVANMQVAFRLDRDGDGTIDATVNSLTNTSGTNLTPLEIKQQVKEIRVYILAHEGTFDRGYRYDGSSTIIVGPDSTVGQTVNLSTLVGTNWNRYRWKTYTLFVKPRGFY